MELVLHQKKFEIWVGGGLTVLHRQKLIELLDLLVFGLALVHALPPHLRHLRAPLLKLVVVLVHQPLQKVWGDAKPGPRRLTSDQTM